MIWFSPKMLVAGSIAIVGLSGGGIAAYRAARPDLHADVAARPAALTTAASSASTMAPTPSPSVAPATPTPIPSPTPSVLGAATKVVASVKPVQAKAGPVVCSSQSYDPRKEQACPHAGAPTKQVSLAALADPAATTATLPVLPVPSPATTSTSTPVATAAPAQVATSTPANVTPSPKPMSIPANATPPANTACGGGYPGLLCNAAQDSLVDPWGMYNRECVSYTAFKVSQSGRHMPYWGGRGNAKQWPDNARAAGIAVDGTPRIGDVAISMAGNWGHAMYVEALSGDRVIVSQYNYGGKGEFSTMSVPAAGLLFLHF